VDALGNPLKIILTAGQVHDLAGADALVPGMDAEALLADKAYDADERVIEPLEAAGKTVVIPPKKNRTNPRTYDKALYEARHLIENFFCCWCGRPPAASMCQNEVVLLISDKGNRP
jgi:transposase